MKRADAERILSKIDQEGFHVLRLAYLKATKQLQDYIMEKSVNGEEGKESKPINTVWMSEEKKNEIWKSILGGKMKSAVITGCLGLIGSHFTDKLLSEGWYVYGIDKETYASNDRYKEYFLSNDNFTLVTEDISKLKYIPDCDIIVNFAAESHVDNSINDSDAFVKTNVYGTKRLLDLAKEKGQYRIPLFVHISTDEVYGDNLTKLAHKEKVDRLMPSNPYAGSKASAEMFVLSYHRTYGVPYIIFRPTNNYGMGQHPEKLIPKAIQLLMRGEKITLHGDGSYQRCWLHASDTAEAIYLGVQKRQICENNIYNLSGDEYLTIHDVSQAIISWDAFPDQVDEEYVESRIEYNFQRQGADVVYRIDDNDFRKITGWKPTRKFNEEIQTIVEQTKKNYRW